MAPLPTIITERTLLTVLQPEQSMLLHRYVNENRDHLAEWEPQRDEAFFGEEAALERVKASLASFESGAAVQMAALDRASGKMVVVCNFNNIVRGAFQACHLGYSVDAAWQGKGLMHEVATAGVGYMFNEAGLHRVMANHLLNNTRSERLLARLGFEREGIARSYLCIAGRWQDFVLTSLINSRD